MHDENHRLTLHKDIATCVAMCEEGMENNMKIVVVANTIFGDDLAAVAWKKQLRAFLGCPIWSLPEQEQQSIVIALGESYLALD